ncbi:hypothetical protein BCR33DRAFT_714503 [Rhizoclosmatium globosum]|uniref:Uncharacterized protein n=1 Tax=Rhizoclosmatium globosum TaxID=329046 RepID=A0A1Y2CMI5_9FUNG|nr:hypothetical protein BCR33DRAFT_714503 [Rhizoclosmatium globosum]|eukprot:ORY48064.1 hypothetical protein BCR33DRAFT_714503 [Rhizoclosmatium globosum]
MAPLYRVKVVVDSNDPAHTHTIRLDSSRSLTIKLNESQLSLKYDPIPSLPQQSTPIPPDVLAHLTQHLKDPHIMHSKYKSSPFHRNKQTLAILHAMHKSPAFQKVHPSLRCTLTPTKQQRKEIWESAPHAPGFNPSSFRLDVLGNLVCKRHNKPESPGPCAYDIEHILPRSHGGKTEVANLCLLNAAVNRYKQDAHLFITGIPAIHAKVKELGVDPALVLRTWKSWFGGRERVKNLWSLDLVRKADGLLDWADAE